MAIKIQVHTGPKSGFAEKSVDHAHHLGALLVDSGCVEVTDLHVGLGPYRMRHGAGVFRKLGGAQGSDFLNALNRP